jgi:parallel beta-helix repeat protein
VAPTGNDANAGTQASPFREIRKGIAVVRAGDTVLVADGSYKGFDITSMNGSSSAWIAIRAQGGNAVVNVTTDRYDNRDTMYVGSSSYILLDGLRAFNANRAAVRVTVSNHVTVRNGVYGNNTTWGIFTDFSDDLLLENNECFGSKQQHGIYVSNTCVRPTVRGNRIHDNASAGLHMNGDASMGGIGIITGALVEKNIIYSNGVTGAAAINMDGVQDSIVRCNVLYNNHATGICGFRINAAQGPKGLTIYNNTVDMASDGRWALRISESVGMNTVRNNILNTRNTGRGGLCTATTADMANVDSDFNIMDKVTADDNVTCTIVTLAQWQALGHELHSLSASNTSLYVNLSAADYHLLSNAPAINRGYDGIISAGETDRDGNPRISGSHVDIGAYEYASAADTTAPVISGVAASGITASGASVTWTTNENSDSQVDYGTSTSYGTSTALNTSLVTAHAASLSGLAAGTLYHYRVKSRDAAGNLAASADFTFTTAAASTLGSGTGLSGAYFAGITLSGTPVTRTDPTINFVWNGASPISGISGTNFSVRWTGQVQAQFSETYTFYTSSDDGVRLYVNGQKLIDNWTYHATTENSGSIALTAGQKYAITLEYFQATGGSVMKLSWASPSTGKTIVPQSQLYPATPSPVVTGSGTGLLGSYFNNVYLSGTAITRTDPTVNFVWTGSSPIAGLSSTNFSVRWTGYVLPQYSETYTFYTQSDDGVRLYVNGQKLIDNWTNHGSTQNSGTIALAAGTRYTVQLDYFQGAYDSIIQLSWASASTPKAVVPQTQLYPQLTAAIAAMHSPLQPVQNAPQIDSEAWADPALVAVGEQTQLSVAASDPLGGTLAYTWTMLTGPRQATFAPDAAEASVNASFDAAGTYTLQVTVANAEGSATSTTDVQVNGAGGATPGTMTVQMLKVLTTTAKASADALQFVATIPGPVTSVAGAAVTIDVAGVQRTFSLDAGRRYRSSSAYCLLRVDSTTNAATVVVRLSRGQWPDVWQSLGVTTDTNSAMLTVPVTVTIGAQSFSTTKQVQFKSARAMRFQAMGMARER